MLEEVIRRRREQLRDIWAKIQPEPVEKEKKRAYFAQVDAAVEQSLELLEDLEQHEFNGVFLVPNWRDYGIRSTDEHLFEEFNRKHSFSSVLGAGVRITRKVHDRLWQEWFGRKTKRLNDD